MAAQERLKMQPQDRLIPKHDISKSPPPCPQCHKEMKLVGEAETNWQFGCERCQFAHVFTKPQAEAAAKHQVQQGRRENQERMYRAYDARKKYFIGGSK